MAAAFVCIALLALALCLRFSYWEHCTVFSLMGGTLALALFLAARKKLMTARAIVESAVICIEPAVICGQGQAAKEEEGLREDFGIYVSCFGILLGTKLIKFNQDGIWLRAVEIGADSISFGYGASSEELQTIRLLYSRPSEDTLADVMESFRKETGVMPSLTGQQKRDKQ